MGDEDGESAGSCRWTLLKSIGYIQQVVGATGAFQSGECLGLVCVPEQYSAPALSALRRLGT